MTHKGLIASCCEVLAEKSNAIWYVDGGYRYADIYVRGEGWESFSCDTQEMWEMLTAEFCRR